MRPSTARCSTRSRARGSRAPRRRSDAARPIARLHALLLARGAVRGRPAAARAPAPARRTSSTTSRCEAADDALMSVLGRLDDFRGASRFTTWVYKFALLEAAVKLRQRAWQGREMPLEPESWSVFSSAGLEPDAEAEQSELLATLQRAIARDPDAAPARRCSSRSRSTACRSTCSPSAWTRPAARSTRRCTTRAGSCAGTWTSAARPSGSLLEETT